MQVLIHSMSRVRVARLVPTIAWASPPSPSPRSIFLPFIQLSSLWRLRSVLSAEGSSLPEACRIRDRESAKYEIGAALLLPTRWANLQLKPLLERFRRHNNFSCRKGNRHGMFRISGSLLRTRELGLDTFTTLNRTPV